MNKLPITGNSVSLILAIVVTVILLTTGCTIWWSGIYPDRNASTDQNKTDTQEEKQEANGTDTPKKAKK